MIYFCFDKFATTQTRDVITRHFRTRKMAASLWTVCSRKICRYFEFRGIFTLLKT